MAMFGKNMKWTVDATYRERIKALFVDALGVPHAPGGPPALDLYRLEDGFQVGVFSVPTAEALRPEDLARAPWLEIAVADPEKTIAKLAEQGVEEVEYVDKAHRYFAVPGGPVFRLTAAAKG